MGIPTRLNSLIGGNHVATDLRHAAATVVGYLGGPENPWADAAGVVVAAADVLGFSSLFGGGGPTLSPSQQAAVHHGISLSTPLPEMTVTSSAGAGVVPVTPARSVSTDIRGGFRPAIPMYKPPSASPGNPTRNPDWQAASGVSGNSRRTTMVSC